MKTAYQIKNGTHKKCGGKGEVVVKFFVNRKGKKSEYAKEDVIGFRCYKCKEYKRIDLKEIFVKK